jgi:hypothetical protein
MQHYSMLRGYGSKPQTYHRADFSLVDECLHSVFLPKNFCTVGFCFSQNFMVGRWREGGCDGNNRCKPYLVPSVTKGSATPGRRHSETLTAWRRSGSSFALVSSAAGSLSNEGALRFFVRFPEAVNDRRLARINRRAMIKLAAEIDDPHAPPFVFAASRLIAA